VLAAYYPNGRQTLHSFGDHGRRDDGFSPEAGVIELNNVLYGTTTIGGSHDGGGTAFAYDLSAHQYQVIHSFGRGADGSAPAASLTHAHGALYGTTTAGGAHNVGTVFSIDPTTGKEKVLYSFCEEKNCADGKDPMAKLLGADDMLFGTTYDGGAGSDPEGTVFSIDMTSGTVAVLHSFGSGSDGANPRAGLINVDGTFYGTTEFGGAHGLGTVFELEKTR
jgi:uncharacterized repeat protein (TIGR03803 family)